MTDALFEIPTREDTRPKVAGRAALPRWALLAPLPAVLAVLAVLVLPLGWTVARSLRRDGRFAGLAEYRVFADDRVARATANSVWWVLFALVLGAAGLGLAELARRAGGSRTLLLAVLAAPTAVSAFVAGAAFRLLFDPDPDRGTVAALVGVLPGDTRPDLLGPKFIAVVLGSAFAWSWIGLAVVVFAAGLRAVPADRLRMARAAGIGPYGRLRKVLLPALRPVLATVLLTLLVAAARTFDLVLVAVPGSVQEAADVVGLQWLRRESDLAEGQRAALVVVLTLFLAAAALLAAAGGSSRRSPAAAGTGDPDPEPPRRRSARWTLRGVGALALVLWLVPLLVLVATSLRDPATAAVHGWWTGGGLSLRSYGNAFASGELAGALTDTATRALLATTAVLVLAVPAAYALAWGGLRWRAARRVAAVCAVLAVLPVQAYAGPLGDALTGARWLGSPTVLAGVHAAAGVPFAVLLLRSAFATVPAGEVVRQRLDGGEWQAAGTVLEQRWESVVAVAVLEFVLVWNDLVVGLLLATPGSRLVTLALLAESREFATNASALAAGAVVVTVIPLLLVLATGRWLIRGLAAGVAR